MRGRYGGDKWKIDFPALVHAHGARWRQFALFTLVEAAMLGREDARAGNEYGAPASDARRHARRAEPRLAAPTLPG
jgi:hypothetical protein